MKQSNPNQPIGVFDSGVGGFTVLNEIHSLMPWEDLIYFGDTARVPYGSKSKDTVVKYSKEILTFLLSKNVKYVVVACNTASSYALDTLKQITNTPVMGVIEPGIDAIIKNSNGHSAAGLVATSGTIKSGSYEEILAKKNPMLKIYSKACPLFVPLVEEGLIEHKITEDTIRLYLEEFQEKKIVNLILGCTHYPVLKDMIYKLYSNFHLIDSSQETAVALKKFLLKKKLLATKKEKGKVEVYVSDSTETLNENKLIALTKMQYSVQKINIE